MKSRKKNSGSVLDELDIRPLTDSEVMALGYEPTPEGWKPYRKELLPARIEPEQSTILENYKKPAKVTEITDAPSRRQSRPGRPSRKAQGRPSKSQG